MPKSKNDLVTKVKRSHSFGGCNTCRRRHVKCDQVRPKCLTCKAAGLECAGYRTDLKWVPAFNASGASTEKALVAHSLSSRRHLYSEKSRISMSSVLQADLASNSVDESILELDTRFKDKSTSINRSYTVGPFGVLDFTGIQQSADTAPSLDTDQDFSNAFVPTDAPDTTSPYTSQSLGSLNNMDDFLDWPDIFELDFAWPDLAPENTSHVIPETTFQSSVPYDFDQAASAQTAVLVLPHDFARHSRDPVLLSNPNTLDSSLKGISPSDAQVLLKHFNDQVIAHLSSLPPGEKPHWTILNVQSATLTLASMTFMQTSRNSNAAITNLMALLAISAYHLAHQKTLEHSPDVSYWRKIGSLASQQAKEHLQISLKTEVSGEGHAKYKDQVMALSAMLAFAILYDRQEEARAYIIDMERLLRIRGLAKRHLSRKIRMLHHMYTWSRIVGESTYVLRNYNPRQTVAAIRSYSNSFRKRHRNDEDTVPDAYPAHNPKLDDFLRLDQDASESDSDMNAQKDQEKGLRDFHLEDPREYSGTMYLQLYGISETWLSLVSQTTRLANIMDSLDADKKRKDVELLESLEQRKQRLEHMVCTFAATNQPMHASTPKQRSDHSINSQNAQAEKETPRSCMVRALNSSLVIFFYRRIRNVHPWILQENVKSVVQALQDFDISCEAFEIEGPGCSWPVFMAGCEAIAQPQREYLSQWLDRAFAKTGFSRFKAIKSCIQDVWKMHDSSNHGHHKRSRDQACSWIHVSREKNINLSLS